jgi:hypothetical protein
MNGFKEKQNQRNQRWQTTETKSQNMTDDLTRAALATWASRGLPTRQGSAATAKLLGFTESDIQILMSVGKLTPLGDPAPNAPKWFAAVEIIRLATDKEWLHKATKEISKYWRQKRGRRNRMATKNWKNAGVCSGYGTLIR